MPSFGMLCRMALVRIDVSEEPSTSTIRVTRISELGIMLTITSNRCMLRRNTKRVNNPEDGILHEKESLLNMLRCYEPELSDFGQGSVAGARKYGKECSM
jgi:hypothetical protein